MKTKISNSSSNKMHSTIELRWDNGQRPIVCTCVPKCSSSINTSTFLIIKTNSNNSDITVRARVCVRIEAREFGTNVNAIDDWNEWKEKVEWKWCCRFIAGQHQPHKQRHIFYVKRNKLKIIHGPDKLQKNICQEPQNRNFVFCILHTPNLIV